jgi:hypothetical protein
LLCKSFTSRATGEEIFEVVNSYMIEHEISLGKCVDVCSDGARTITRKPAGVVARIKELVPSCRQNDLKRPKNRVG